MNQHVPPPEDEPVAPVDVWRYLRYLLRYWWIVAAATIAGGVLAYFAVWIQPPMYLGTTRLAVMGAGSGAAGNAIVTFQAMVGDEAVLQRTLARLKQEGGADALTVADLRRSLSPKLPYPPTNYLVEARYGDARLAASMAAATAREALSAAQAVHRQRLDATRALLRERVVAADKIVADARTELAAFRRQNGRLIRFVPPADVTEQREEARAMALEIRVERAALAVLEREAEKLSAPEARSSVPEAYYSELLTRVLSTRATVAALEAHRSELQVRIRAYDAARPTMAAQAAVMKQLDELTQQVVKAEQNRDVVVAANRAEEADEVQAIDALHLIETPPGPGHSVRNLATALPRGMASGLVLSVFGVLFLRGFRQE